jgi:hypothetical protein
MAVLLALDVAVFACCSAGARGDIEISTHPCGGFVCAAGMYLGDFVSFMYIFRIPL